MELSGGVHGLRPARRAPAIDVDRVSAGGLQPYGLPLPAAEPLLLRGVLPAETPVTIAETKGRCAALQSRSPIRQPYPRLPSAGPPWAASEAAFT